MPFDLLAFYEAEAVRVHDLLDLLDVPRITTATGPLTMAQRLEHLVQAQRDTRDVLRRIQ